jgi:hypothetical protein
MANPLGKRSDRLDTFFDLGRRLSATHVPGDRCRHDRADQDYRETAHDDVDANDREGE